MKKNLPELLGQDLALKLTGAFEFVHVAGGNFEMWDTSGGGYTNEEPVLDIRIDSFFIGKFLVTQEQWQIEMGENPSHFQFGKISGRVSDLS